MMERKSLKIAISGGGTGGHIFPAVSIANAIRESVPEADILFVGAEGRMEMERVPAAGYKIIGLPVVGLQRRLTLKNLAFPFRLLKSFRRAKRIVKDFQPHLAVGVGGYASAPILRAAQSAKIPTLIQEQNSYAGIANKMLAKRANLICVAYEGMERFFPKEKIVLTGNPIRQGLENVAALREEAFNFFNIPKGNRVLLVIGGSLGAKTINESILDCITGIAAESKLTLLWQTGKLYYNGVKEEVGKYKVPNILVFDFINRMDLAYAASNVVIARAGAGTISELCVVGKPSILVPSPNVAEDHQTKNAQALSEKGAAILIPDLQAKATLIKSAIELLGNPVRMAFLSDSIKAFAKPLAAQTIARLGLDLCKQDGSV